MSKALLLPILDALVMLTNFSVSGWDEKREPLLLSQSAKEEPNVIYTGVGGFVPKRRVSDTTPTVLLYNLIPD